MLPKIIKTMSVTSGVVCRTLSGLSNNVHGVANVAEVDIKPFSDGLESAHSSDVFLGVPLHEARSFRDEEFLFSGVGNCRESSSPASPLSDIDQSFYPDLYDWQPLELEPLKFGGSFHLSCNSTTKMTDGALSFLDHFGPFSMFDIPDSLELEKKDLCCESVHPFEPVNVKIEPETSCDIYSPHSSWTMSPREDDFKQVATFGADPWVDVPIVSQHQRNLRQPSRDKSTRSRILFPVRRLSPPAASSEARSATKYALRPNIKVEVPDTDYDDVKDVDWKHFDVSPVTAIQRKRAVVRKMEPLEEDEGMSSASLYGVALRRERNRLAAQRYRARCHRQKSALKREVQEVVARNSQLSKEKARLLKEVQYYKAKMNML